jgi:hypothetical protein
LGDSKRGGFTLAPEAATEKMRNIINKYVTDDELKETADAIYARDWRTIKLYFMIGHPNEDLEDVRAIAELCKDVVGIGRKYHGRKAAVNAGVSTFIPKPHTPFQWVPMDSVENVVQKQNLLKDRMKMTGLRLRWNDPLESVYEGFLSRGDRRIANVLERAWRKGAKFDAWGEYFDMSIWEESFEEEGLEIAFYNYRQRPINEVFPWEHIDVAITRKFLTEDYLMSEVQETRVDCRDQCFACGILPKLKDMRRETSEEAWQCPPVKKRKNHKPREVVMPDTSIALPMVN